jgi:hypothetical protein
MGKKNKKRSIVKSMKALARERIPVGSIRTKVVPSKRKAIREKIAKKEARRDSASW